MTNNKVNRHDENIQHYSMDIPDEGTLTANYTRREHVYIFEELVTNFSGQSSRIIVSKTGNEEAIIKECDDSEDDFFKNKNNKSPRDVASGSICAFIEGMSPEAGKLMQAIFEKKE